MDIDLSTSTFLYFSRGMETFHKPAGESAAADPTASLPRDVCISD